MSPTAGELKWTCELSVSMCAVFVFKSSILKIPKSLNPQTSICIFNILPWRNDLFEFPILRYTQSSVTYTSKLAWFLLSEFKIRSNTTCISILHKLIFHGDIPSETNISWHYLLLLCSGISVQTVMIAHYFPLANFLLRIKFVFYSSWSALENKYILMLHFCYMESGMNQFPCRC